jgi:DNA polymerase III delta prime subunit
MAITDDAAREMGLLQAKRRMTESVDKRARYILTNLGRELDELLLLGEHYDRGLIWGTDKLLLTLSALRDEIEPEESPWRNY